MGRVRFLLLVLVAFFGFSGLSKAELLDRGGGLIYDDVLKITWLQDANYAQTSGYDDDLYSYDTNGRMHWSHAVAWADQLTYGGYDDWRLPTTVDGPYSDYGYDGTTTAGYNITTSEMGYMYYVNLGNLGLYDPLNGPRQPGTWGLKNTEPFKNLQPAYYWSGTEYADFTLNAWVFNFYNGEQTVSFKELASLYAWAVRDGDVDAVPIPGAVWLFGSGLVVIIGISRRIRF